MKNRTVIRARAKGCAEYYKPKGLSAALVRSFDVTINHGLPKDHDHEWFVHIYTDKDYPEEFIGFGVLSDALCYARDVAKFGGLPVLPDYAIIVKS